MGYYSISQIKTLSMIRLSKNIFFKFDPLIHLKLLTYLRSVSIEEVNGDHQNEDEEGNPRSLPHFGNVAIEIGPSWQTRFIAKLCKTV